MDNSKKQNPEMAKKLQELVSQGMSDTAFSGQPGEQQAPSDKSTKEKTEEVEKVEPIEPTEPIEKTESTEKEVIQAEQSPAPVRRKRKEQPENYREIYFRRIDFSDRQPLYITRSTHERLMMNVGLIGRRKATISSYVENILLQHLEINREEINRLSDEYYAKKRNEFLNKEKYGMD